MQFQWIRDRMMLGMAVVIVLLGFSVFSPKVRAMWRAQRLTCAQGCNATHCTRKTCGRKSCDMGPACRQCWKKAGTNQH